jgi:hypothetical protein
MVAADVMPKLNDSTQREIEVLAGLLTADVVGILQRQQGITIGTETARHLQYMAAHLLRHHAELVIETVAVLTAMMTEPERIQ